MKFLILLAIFIESITAQSIFCIYSGTQSSYTCNLVLNNPEGYDNFTEIVGIHLSNLEDLHVQIVTIASGISPNFPRIICDKFRNTRFINFQNVHLEEIGLNSFYNCQVLSVLNLGNNAINRINKYAFVRNTELTTLTLSKNQINSIDSSFFSRMSTLTNLNLDNNPLGDMPVDVFR